MTSGDTCLCNEGGQALAEAAQRSCGCSIPRSVQGKVGWSSEKHGIVEGVPAFQISRAVWVSFTVLPLQL